MTFKISPEKTANIMVRVLVVSVAWLPVLLLIWAAGPTPMRTIAIVSVVAWYHRVMTVIETVDEQERAKGTK